MAEIPEATSFTPPAVSNDEKHQLSFQGHSNPKDQDSSRSSQLTNSPKSWEKSGFKAKSHRTWRNIQRYIWDDPDKPAVEKKFLLKLDFFLLSYTCLGYFCKNLDQANISNAYVSGMKEALHMGGNELTYMSNVFTAGYVVGQLPAVILATKIRPSILVSTLEILWAVFTFCCAAVKTVPQLYALRFLVGLCEGAFFPVIIYVISSWYTKVERGKRVTLFYSTATMAGMFSGYLQAGAYKGLNGKLGHEGWQWLYIICGIISLPVGIIGYFFNPDFPENTRAFYLSPSETELARQRLLRDGYKPLGASAWDRKKIFRIMAQWQFWVLPLGYFFVQSSFPNAQPAFALYLKATGRSVYEINVWPTGQAAVGVVVQIAAGMLSDSPLLNGRRWQAITFMQAGTFIGAIIIVVWNVPEGARFFAYYISYMCAGVPGIYYSWFPELMPHDHEMRGFLTAFINIASYVNQIWVADAVWRTVEAPRFRPGFIFASVTGVCLVVLSLGLHFLEKRDVKKRAVVESEAGRVDVESPLESEKL
ncbi:MFS general substrate transporter [Mollisia scopiformis]|uniref:MFS general substrate transporter n=1 Tax=Mollisia scopiformis TaxID=149040 RepID=A0A194WZG0_MOLSC|nr:MFS general substrate transporter [Mollisia scopiformis]KUJ13333.1 MFS general substrate transporter [Mollisia scopiformis]